ncbi:MAG: hypothetical protein J0L77_01230 [Alphaproteobacteria bacterium]|nr:hypothetical protein [Alphaproteobacteria bacterium]
MNSLFTKICVWGVILLCLIPAGAIANIGKIQASSAEDVALLFYRMANARPSFDLWIKETEPYSVTALARRDEVYASQMARLVQAWQKLDPATSVITLVTPAIGKVEITSSADSKTPPVSVLNIRFAHGLADYFPYDFREERFVVIPTKLKERMNPVLTPDLAKNLQAALGTGKNLRLVMTLKPLRSDISGVQDIDGIPSWLMSADIASLSLWTPAGSLVWEYVSPIPPALITPTQKPSAAAR